MRPGGWTSVKSAFLCGVLGCGFLGWGTPASGQVPKVYTLEGEYGLTHDPSIAKEGGTYSVFATGKAKEGGQLPVRCSEDLVHWRMCGHVFDEIPKWIVERSPETKDLWAPDISFEHGVYRLYYSYSLWGKNTSGIGLATNRTLDAKNAAYRWEDRGVVLESKAEDDFNAIDPAYVRDVKGGEWLVFGSFWTGIKMRALDGATGGVSAKDTKLYSLAMRSRKGKPRDSLGIEAPFVVAHGGFYYLFVSFGQCCQGTRSTYETMVGRSKAVTGPYLDREGKSMMEGGGTAVLVSKKRWVGPGGASVLRDSDGKYVMVFHAYDSTTGKPALQVSNLVWEQGWPLAGLGDE